MKIFTILCFILTFLFLFNACKDSQSNEANQIIISGKVSGYNPPETNQSLLFSFRDLIRFDREKVILIDEKGEFSFKAYFPYAQNFFLRYYQFCQIYAEPGDSIFISIDLMKDSLDKSTYNANFSVSGDNSTFNKELREVTKADRQILNSSRRKKYRTIFENSQKDYYSFIDSLYEKRSKTITLNSSKKLQAFSNDFLYYSKLNDIIEYPWFKQRLQKESPSEIKRDQSFYESINEFKSSELKYISSAQNDFYNNIFVLVNGELSSKSKQAIKSKSKEDKYWNSILLTDKYFEDDIRDITIAKIYFEYYLQYGLKKFNNFYKHKLIDSPKVQKLLKETIKQKESELKQEQFEKNLLASNYSIYPVEEVVSKLKSIGHKKHLVLDFWGPWCGPCLEDINYLKRIKKFFKNSKLEFVHLAINTNQKAWKDCLKKHKFDGTHLLLNEDQANFFKSQYHILGYPQYVLLDRKLNCLNNNLGTAKNMSEFIKNIETHLHPK